MIHRYALLALSSLAVHAADAQWAAGGIFSTVVHFQACAFHTLDTGLFVYGANNPGPGSVATEGGLIFTDDGDASGGYYVWYQPSMNLEDIDVKMAGTRPLYMAAGHEIYARSIVVRPYAFLVNPLAFDSVRTGDDRHYRAIRMRNDLVAFAAGGNAAGDGIIDMSVDTGATWTNIATLPGQPVSRLHFVDDLLGFAATGGYRRLTGNGIFLPDSGAIYRTVNGGLSWQQVHSDATEGFSDVAFSTSMNGVATRNDGVILRTTDGGDTWNPAFVAVAGPYVMTSVTFRPDGVGFASCYRADGTAGYILISYDGGANWFESFSTAGLNHSRRIYDLYFHDDAHGYASTHIRPLRTTGIVLDVANRTMEPLRLFPDPTDGDATLVLSERAVVAVFDALGRQVLGPLTGAAGPLLIPMGSMPAGSYVVRVRTSSGTQSMVLVRL